MIRVAIADDQQLIRAGFRSLLEAEPDIEIVGRPAAARRPYRSRSRRVPMSCSWTSGCPTATASGPPSRSSATPTWRRPHRDRHCPSNSHEYVGRAIRAGASGFLVKDTEPDEFIRAVHVVAAGDALLSPTVTRRLLERLSSELRKRPTRASCRSSPIASARCSPWSGRGSPMRRSASSSS